MILWIELNIISIYYCSCPFAFFCTTRKSLKVYSGLYARMNPGGLRGLYGVLWIKPGQLHSGQVPYLL